MKLRRGASYESVIAEPQPQAESLSLDPICYAVGLVVTQPQAQSLPLSLHELGAAIDKLSENPIQNRIWPLLLICMARDSLFAPPLTWLKRLEQELLHLKTERFSVAALLERRQRMSAKLALTLA
jgi:hypothetical protein